MAGNEFWKQIRHLRNLVPLTGSREEKINFVKFDGDGDCPGSKETVLDAVYANGANNTGQINALTAPDLEKHNGLFNAMELEENELKSVDGGRHRDQITALQAGWNVTNAIQGMFIVSFPYAVLQGGYWALLAMVVVAWICCHTGKILVACLYEVDRQGRRVRVRDSYVDIAEEVWGKQIGGRVVSVAQIIELLMTCILYMVLCGDLMLGSFPSCPLDLSSWIMISCAFLVPCAFLTNLRHVSWLSFWCTMAHMVINAIIIIFCLTRAGDWQWSKVQIKIDIWTFPISMGIVVFSYTSQIFLPSLEGNMRVRSQFHCMMHWTHIAAAVFKALFSYVCFLTWGTDTKEVITNNLPTHEFKVIVNLILTVKALLSYPLPYYAAVELLETTFFRGRPQTSFPSCMEEDNSLKVWALSLRIGLVIVTLVLAIYIPHFALLMGLIGSFTGTMLSLVWPCWFHIKIKGKEMSLCAKIVDVIIIIFGFLVTFVGIYYSGHALLRALRGLSVEPQRTIPIYNAIYNTSSNSASISSSSATSH